MTLDAATCRARARAAYIQRVVDEAPPPPDELVALAVRAFLTKPTTAVVTTASAA